MSQPNYTHLALILDASDSMRSFANDLKRSCLAFLEAQKQLEGTLTTSIIVFNDNPTWAVSHFLTPEEAIAFVRRQYKVSGGTALYDAIGNAATDIASKITRISDEAQPEKVILAIVTDGKENGNSNKHNAQTVKEIVDHHEDVYNWEFLYVGANQDAYNTGRQFGIKAGKALSYAATSKGLIEAMNAVSGAVTRYRQNGAPHANEFFAEEDHAYQQALGAARAPLRS